MSVTTTLNATHRCMRLLNGMLIITECTLDLVLSVQGERDKAAQAERIERQRWWLENVFDGCVIVPTKPDWDPSWLAQINNLVMFAPAEPNDFLVQVLIHAKLEAIGEGLVGIASSHMSTDHSRGFGMAFDGDPDELLPSNADWMGPRAYWPRPWWHRSDASMMDVPCGPEDDILDRPDIIVPWDSLLTTDDSRRDERSAEIIRPSFGPRLVDGGDD